MSLARRDLGTGTRHPSPRSLGAKLRRDDGSLTVRWRANASHPKHRANQLAFPYDGIDRTTNLAAVSRHRPHSPLPRRHGDLDCAAVAVAGRVLVGQDDGPGRERANL